MAPANIMTEQKRERLRELCAEANSNCAKWERSAFDLGSMSSHAARLKSFAHPELKQAHEAGLVTIWAGSAYYAPRFYITDELKDRAC